MKITYLLSGVDFFNGCIHFRNVQPCAALAARGHDVGITLLGEGLDQNIILTSDVVVFSRVYGPQILPVVDLCRKMKKPMVYELDDDLEGLDDTNPTQAPIDRAQSIIRLIAFESKAITTTTPYLAAKLKERYHKDVFVCPNALDLGKYEVRPRDKDKIVMGWSGGCSHSADLLLVLDTILELQKKHKFEFHLQGFSLAPIEAQEYVWRRLNEILPDDDPQKNYIKISLEMCNRFRQIKGFRHIPFYPTELFPQLLSRLSWDIGLAPLHDTEFNRAKSCIKYYEYAATGTLTLASDVIPYNTEMDYVVQNTPEDWYAKLEEMILNANRRREVLREQRNWVIDNRTMDKAGKIWEDAFTQVLGG